jgi:predicted GH43/DUF377 family glycosyl hydrolase
VQFDAEGNPAGVQRLAHALEPVESYEYKGVEDARVTFVPELDQYLMNYVAVGDDGPRVALAVSNDLKTWERRGLTKFAHERGVDFGNLDNKDAFVIPKIIKDPSGRDSLAMIHRPDFQVNSRNPGNRLPDGITEKRPSIWISYTPLTGTKSDLSNICEFGQHRMVAGPMHDWEKVKIGAGPPPVETAEGWLMISHGVDGRYDEAGTLHGRRYTAGAMLLDKEDPSKLTYRSSRPILAPDGSDELKGAVDNVVFPTAVDDRGGGRVDVYYGMADSRIGVGMLHTK